jgi:hypothetical protein
LVHDYNGFCPAFAQLHLAESALSSSVQRILGQELGQMGAGQDTPHQGIHKHYAVPRVRQAIALPVYTVALVLDYLSAALGMLAAASQATIGALMFFPAGAMWVNARRGAAPWWLRSKSGGATAFPRRKHPEQAAS